MMSQLNFRIAATISLLVCMVGQIHAQTATPATGIRVQVYGIHYGGNMVYHYKVINNTDTPFNNFTIGSYFNIAEDYSFPQLTRLPLGWSFGREGETGTAIILAPGGTKQPAYWTSRVFGQQDTGNYYLEWDAPWGDKNMPNVVKPGQTLSGFSVTIPLVDNEVDFPMVKGQPVYTGPDEKYIKGGFMVGFGSGRKFQKVWGTLERLDTTPPTLSVTISPDKLWPANGKLVPITATITVKDDYDPQPEVKLESITANVILTKEDGSGVKPGTDNRKFMLKAEREGKNKAGRIYTVTYSATDGSGNKSTTSATVTVPHDEREHEGSDRGDKK